MRPGRAAAWLLLLAASHVVSAGVSGVVARRQAVEGAQVRADGAADSLRAELFRESQALRSVAGLIATDPELDTEDPRATLEARWPHLTVDLLALDRGGEVTTVGVSGSVALASGLGPGPLIARAGGAAWLLVGESRPVSGEVVHAGKRVDGVFLEGLADRLDVDLALALDGALAADRVRGGGGGGALLAAAEGLVLMPDGEAVVVRIGDADRVTWVVAAPLAPGLRVPLTVGLVGTSSVLLGAVLLMGGGQLPQAPQRSPTPTPTAGMLDRRSREALMESRRRVQMFARTLNRLALELRTSITAVIGYAELLKEEAQREERWSAASDVDRILVGARAGLDLVQDTLALAAMEQGQSVADPGAFQLGTVLHDVVAALRPVGASLGTRIELEAGDLGSVYTDRVKVRHVVRNLISRGLQAAPGGVVRVVAVLEGVGEGARVRVDVHDDGPSLTPAQLDGLFAVSPLDASDPSGPGSSLGLMVARRFAERLGGEIHAMTGASGGTTLTVQIPAQLSPAAVQDALRATERSPGGVER